MRGSSDWATLQCNEVDIVSTMEQWFYTTSKTQERTGDVAMTSFSYVQPIRIQTDCDSVSISLSDYNPFKKCYFVVYTWEDGCLRILGGVIASQVEAQNGFFLLEKLERKRSFFPDYVEDDEEAMPMIEEESSVSEEEEETPLFYLPVIFEEQMERFSQLSADPLLLYTKLNWILECMKCGTMDRLHYGWARADNGRPPMLKTPEIDLACMLLMMVVSDHILYSEEERVRHDQFEQGRSMVELALFNYRIKYHITVEDDMIELFRFNGIWDTLVNKHSVIPQAEDYYFYWKRFPQYRHEGPPAYFFRVPMEQLPLESLATLPIQYQAHVHITFRDMAMWIWHRANLLRRQFFTTAFSKRPNYFPNTLLNGHVYELTGEAVAKLADIPLNTFKRRVDDAVHCPDIEDLAGSMMPPCMATLVKNKFPKDQERVALVRTLRHAGISIETTGDLLHAVDKKERGDKVTKAQTKARYNWEHAHRRKYAPVYCTMLVANSIDMPPHARVPKCPYAHGVYQNVDKKIPKKDQVWKTTEGCREICFTQVKRKNPKVWPNDKQYLSGPHKPIQWALRK